MRKASLSTISTNDLVESFATECVAQDNALLAGSSARFNRHFDRMMIVLDELARRGADHRRQLLRLFEHPNMQARVQAAKLTLAVAPLEARQQLQAIADSKWYPQAGDAGMSLRNLKSGIFKPV